MKKHLQILLFLAISITAYSQNLKVVNLRCEYKINPSAIESPSPRLSWELQSGNRNTMQTAYRILVTNDSSSLKNNAGNVWDSQKVNSGTSIQVAYQGRQLQAAKKYYWKVTVWDNHKHVSVWSAVAAWQMGLLKPADWAGASWIAYEKMPDSNRILPGLAVKGEKKKSPGTDILPLLRKSFVVSKPVKNATIFISGLGHLEMSLNGKKVGDHFLDPGWVDYQKQALYVSFDITKQLLPGANAIGVMLGNGFYFTPSGRYRKLTVAYGYPKMVCRLLIEYSDGTSENIVSNGSWKAAPGPVIFSAMYGGEDYNAGMEQKDWDMPLFKDNKWKDVITVNGPAQLLAQTEEPLKVFDVFEPKKSTQLKPGVWVYDLGQNASGIPRITVKGKKGDTVTITPAELVNSDGTANQKATGKVYCYKYILKGGSAETWQPRFSYYGFRYLQVDGVVSQQETNPKNLPRLIAINGLHTRNAASRAGDFTCSNDLFNKTNTLIDWAIQSNMVSVFTDCPHREKLGWLEQDHLMGNSIQYNYDIANLCKKVISDMKAAQTADGLIPEIAPEFDVFGDGFRDSPEWGSSSVLLPWYVYQWYGDKQVLADSYLMMQRYIGYLEKKADKNILSQGLGDWFDIGPNRPGVSQLTPKGVTATAFYYYDLYIMNKIALLLNKPADAAGYARQANVIRSAFNHDFFNPQTKQYGTGSQAANSVAVYMGLVEPQNASAVINNIVADLQSHNNTLTAGDIGYRYLLKVLDEAGRSDVIFDMNSRSDVPGYGYQLEKGATALTESWQAYPSVSNNHLMLGHIMEWFYGGLAGIKSADDAVAYNKIVIKPQPVGDVTFARASYHAVYGEITSDWKKLPDGFELAVEIPANTTALVYLPAGASSKISESGKLLTDKKPENGYAVIAVGSGSYHFKSSK